MEKKSSRCFSRFLCCSERTPSSRDAKHASTTAEGPSSKIPPIQNEGQNCGSSSSMVVVPNHAGSLPINSAPTVPSSSNPSPFSHNNVMERGPSPSSNAITDNEPLPSSSKVQSACSFQDNPSPTPDVLEESSSQLSEIADAHNDEPQLVLPSASSSRVTALSDLINNIREDAQTVNQTLDAVIDKISKQLDAIKENESQKSKESKNKSETILSQESESQKSKESQKKPEKTTNKLLSITSAGLLKLKDLLLEGVNGICSLKDALPAPEASKIARDVVKGLGQAHWVTSGFLLVAYILDRFETLSSNREGCWSLLDQMYWLARDIKQIMNLKGQEHLARSGTALIVEASLTCCTQIDRREFSKFFSTSVDSDELKKLKEILQDFNLRMIRGMQVWLCSKFWCTLVRRPKPIEKKYPDHAVGIDEPFNNVTKLLQWEREERAVAVILHGFGGIGKTTLADAVFARYYVKDCKYSVVRLGSSPDIVKWQKIILRDLMRGTEERTSEATEGDEILDIEGYKDGGRKIGELLQKEVAFIYIDNVVEADSIDQLFSTRKFKDAKKLRLLITTRDINVRNQLRNIKLEVHEMQPLPGEQRKSFLREEMCIERADINAQITDSELDKLVKISGGVPKLLEMISGFIRNEPDKRKAYRIVMQDGEKLAGNTFMGIDKYIFAYDNLPDECKNPFLDICYYFKGWEWETVENIVGESQLKALESRSLVSKDKDMISLHDVILTIGKEKAHDPRLDSSSRFDFTNATASQIEDFFEKDMEYLKLVKGLWFSDQTCKIPLDSLNSMHNSLRIFGHKMALEEGQCEKTFDKLLVYKGETPQFPFKWSRLKNIRFLSYRPQNLTLLQEIPSWNLKHIELDGSLCSVSQISLSDIQQLRVLQVLRLINFQNLEELPEEWGESLGKNLKELTLSHCTAMKQLAGSISQLTRLRILKLDNCCNLRRLPNDCDSWSSSLEKLNMWNCLSLKSVPNSFGKALDSDSRRLFEHKGILSDSPQSDSDSDYED